MNWIAASLLMYAFSVVMYLSTRAAQKRNIPKEVYSLWAFGLPAIILFGISVVQKQPLDIGLFNWVLLVVSAIFFSWLGNYFSQLSMLSAPNPGYSLIISKSYVVYTALASVWLFHSTLTIKSVVGILLIILFSAVIIFSSDVKSKESHSFAWFWYSIGAFFCLGSLALASKYALTHGVTIVLRLLIIHTIVSILLYSEIKLKKISFISSIKDLPLLALLGISGGLFNFFMQVGFSYSPNPGFVNAANAASISAVTILSAWFFKDSLNMKKMFGVLGVTFGLILIMI